MGDGPVRVFILSPASLSGVRGRAILEGRSGADFMEALRGPGAPLEVVFEHISTLYFRGKRAYAARFACCPEGTPGRWVVTSSRGLVPADTPVRMTDLREMAERDIDAGDPRYVRSLRSTGASLRRSLGSAGEAVLLGSLASDKYVAPLLEVFGDRLLVPRDFVGRGDMSRGGLMLRRVDAGSELPYVPASAAPRRGPRPPRLDPR